jgi:cell filamentation protein
VTLEGYDAFEDQYLYKGTQCLKNRLRIRDAERLAAFELEVSTLRSEEPLPIGSFDPLHYRRIHRHLFQDVYAWAGRYRTVRTGKGGNWFCYPENIPDSMKQLFRRLVTADFQTGGDDDRFLDALAEFLAELNAIHPFREGNGRAQLAFVHLLALRANKPLDLSRVRPDRFLPAMIESFAGETSNLRFELAAMRT